MTTEQAILQLRKRADYAQQKADTADKKRKAADFVAALNTVIDFYNKTESARDEQNKLCDIITVLCEYIGLSETDIIALKEADARFVRKRALCWSANITDITALFHRVAHDCYRLEDDIRMLDYCRSTLIPFLIKREDESGNNQQNYETLRLAESQADQLEEYIHDCNE